MTNFDAIKDMTLEQLAAWLADIVCVDNGCTACPALQTCMNPPRGCCAISFKAWLNEEA